MTDNTPIAPQGEFVLFQSKDGSTRVECRFEAETLWLSQAMMCDLYGKSKATISEHISNILAEKELDENSVVRFYRTTASDGKPYNIKYFSLPMVIAVGYRVRSTRGTQFRKWATQTLQEYLIKGFVMDDARLKNPPVGDSMVPDYFEEMLDQFLSFNDRDVLKNSGHISKKAADEKAKQVFDPFAEQRRRLKEAEGAKANISALHVLAKDKK